MSNPLDTLEFPVSCEYAGCGAVLNSGIEVDEHISEEHLCEAVWVFAMWNMKPTAPPAANNSEDTTRLQPPEKTRTETL